MNWYLLGSFALLLAFSLAAHATRGMDVDLDGY
jgi:hypothetical protein